LFDAAAVALDYLTCVTLGIRRVFAWLISLVFSLELVPFELWLAGGHQDHYTIFFVAFFAWAMVNRWNSAGFRYDFLTALAGGLLIAQSSVAMVTVPFIVLIPISIHLWPKDRSLLLKRMAIAASLPLIIAMGLSAKNLYNAGTFSTSSVGGQNMMQFVFTQRSGDLDAILLEEPVLEYHVWWRWCSNRATERYGNVAALYGACFRSGDLEPTGYDFEPLYQELIREGRLDIARVVQFDIKTLEEKPWLFSGPVGESSTRFAAGYGRESTKVWINFALTRPGDFLRAGYHTHQVFLRHGKRHLENVFTPHYKRPSITAPLSSGFSLLLFATGLLSYVVLIGVVLVYLLKGRLRRLDWIRQLSQQANFPIGLILLGIAYTLTAMLFSFFSCCENDRFFVQVIPYLIPLSAYLLDFVARFLGQGLAVLLRTISNRLAR
jgi:hypothetical protein